MEKSYTSMGTGTDLKTFNPVLKKKKHKTFYRTAGNYQIQPRWLKSYTSMCRDLKSSIRFPKTNSLSQPKT